MMKKYFSNIFALAALLMAGAAFTACSSDDNSIEQPANPTAPKTYTLTINASKGANASTRALALDGTKLVASWENGDVLTVFNVKKNAALTGSLTASNASGSTATFSGALTGTIEKDDVLTLSYHQPTGMSDYSAQAGTLASAAARDYAIAQVTVASVEDGNITTTDDASFQTQTAMLKLTLEDGDNNKLNATQLKVSATITIYPMPAMTEDLATFNLTDATYTANGDGILYFALPDKATVAAALATKIQAKVPSVTTDAVKDALAEATLTYTATVGSDTYTATKTGYTFAAGTYYAGTLTMTKPAAAYTMAANATAGDVGKLICTDGHIHAYSADAACTKSRVAMIAYVGNDAETSSTNTAFKNGLALALEDVSDTKTWCSQEIVTCLGTQYISGTKFNDLAGIANTDALVNHTGHTHAAANAARGYNSGTHPTGTSAWFLPSAGQWSKMATAAGSYANLKTNAGLQAGAKYWSSTESHEYDAWRFNSNNGAWTAAAKDLDGTLVRACLAF
jgi:hypothetical protein